MANTKAWEDRDAIINIAEGFQKIFDDLMGLIAQVEKFKLEVLGNSTRVAELKKIIDEDPNWTIEDIQTKCGEIKTVYDFLTALRE